MRDPHASRGLLREGDRDPVTLFWIVSAEKARFPVSLICEVLDVNRSSFSAWETRPPSDRTLSDAWLTEQIREIWAANRTVYGARRVPARVASRARHPTSVARAASGSWARPGSPA